MSKRFIETELWKKPWFRKLGPMEKLGYIYMFTTCDNVGVWEPDEEDANFKIGSKVNWEAIAEAIKDDIEPIDEKRIFMKFFCRFQYTTIEGTQNARKSYRYLAAKHGLLEKIRDTYIRGYGESQALPKASPRLGLGLAKATPSLQEQDQDFLSSGVREDSSEDSGDISNRSGGAPHSSSKRLRPGVAPHRDECPDCFKLGWGTPMTRVNGVLDCPVHGDPDRERGPA